MSTSTDHPEDSRRSAGAPLGPRTGGSELPPWAPATALGETFSCALEDAGGRTVFSGLAEFIQSGEGMNTIAFVPTADRNADAGLVSYLRIGSRTVVGVELAGTTHTAKGNVAMEVVCDVLESSPED